MNVKKLVLVLIIAGTVIALPFINRTFLGANAKEVEVAARLAILSANIATGSEGLSRRRWRVQAGKNRERAGRRACILIPSDWRR